MKQIEYAEAKALAYFLCRELIEDIHSEYNIPNNVIAEIDRKAVDRAQMYLELSADGKNRFNSMAYYYCQEWDNPRQTDEWYKIKKFYDKPLVVYDVPGKYTKEIMEIYGYEEKCTC